VDQYHLGAVDERDAPEVVEHDPAVPGQGPGWEGYRQPIARLLSAFPDVRITIGDLLADAD